MKSPVLRGENWATGGLSNLSKGTGQVRSQLNLKHSKSYLLSFVHSTNILLCVKYVLGNGAIMVNEKTSAPVLIVLRSP